MKTFVCNESQEVLSIFDYQPSNMTARYKANRNGLQVVIQITPVPNSSRKAIYSDLNNLSLCQGFQEKDFLSRVEDVENSLNQILIEAQGSDVVYRSRECHQILDDESQICSSCSSLLLSKQRGKRKRSLDYKEEENVESKLGNGDLSEDDDNFDDNAQFEQVLKKRKLLPDFQEGAAIY